MPAYPDDIERLNDHVLGFPDGQQPACRRSGSSAAAELTVSLAPMTSTTSVSEKVVVDLVHFEDHGVGHLRLGEQHVHVRGQPAGDGVDPEADVDAPFAQPSGELGDAAAEPRLAAAAPFYGPFPEGGDLRGTRAAVLGVYGEQDARVNATLPEAEAALEAARLKYELLTFEEAGHAFFNDTGERYDPHASAEAWRRTLNWFDDAERRPRDH